MKERKQIIKKQEQEILKFLKRTKEGEYTKIDLEPSQVDDAEKMREESHFEEEEAYFYSLS